MKVLMVCLGNICRSPMAEGIMQDLAKEKSLDLFVESAGTSGWHKGEKPHIESIRISAQNGIDISNQQSRQFRTSDFQDFDLILAMDLANKEDILRLSNSEEERGKVKLLLTFNSQVQNVPDPYYEGGFGGVFDLIKEGCLNWLSHIEKTTKDVE